MKTLLFEDARTLTTPATASAARRATITPFIRPRMQGNMGALRGQAFQADLADEAVVTFHVRPTTIAILGSFEAFVRIRNFPTLEQMLTSTGTSTWAFPEWDVSGRLLLYQGILTFTVPVIGVCDVQLALLSRHAAAQQVYIVTQVFGNVRVLDVKGEADGDPPTPEMVP